MLANLLSSASELAALLPRTLAGRQWLDAYLVSAGLVQILEDHLHPDPFLLRRAAVYLVASPSPVFRLAGELLSITAAIGRRVRLRGARRRLLAACRELTWVRSALAATVMNSERNEPDPVELIARVGALRSALPAVADEIVRMPACFRSFDQHPDDLAWLARRFIEASGFPPTRVCVVGVRTSGSYLAPLLAAALGSLGVPQVHTVSYRPDRPFLAWEVAVLAETARAGGRVVVTDDPPGSGRSLHAAVRAVVAAGVADGAITLLLSMFDEDPVLPAVLRQCTAILQPWSHWTVHQRVAAGRTAEQMRRLLQPRWRLEQLHPRAADERPGRGHIQARFAMQLIDNETGSTERRELVVEGAGVGYLGRYALAVRRALPGQLPHVYGFGDGLLYREWLPRDGRPPDDQAAAVIVSNYVIARARALPAADNSRALRGRDPAWEVCARQLSQAFGRLSPVVRPCLLEPLSRRLLATGRASIVDGATDLSQWLPDPAGRGWRKVGFHQQAFSNDELTCYDAVFDLAGAAATTPGREFQAALRGNYERTTGERIDDERWLLYRLAHLWRHRKAGTLDPYLLARLSATAVHDYLAGCYLRGPGPSAGPLCAIDLDGVLETDRLGYPTISPGGALSLSSLMAHGFRPVLATGRSLDDARDRCAAFGLSGAVAEYGAVAYHHPDGAVTDLRTAEERELIAEVRRALGAAGVEVDPGYRHSVRARHHGGPLPPGLVCGMQILSRPGLRVIRGDGQTDITVTRIDKTVGLRELAEQIGEHSFAFAMGDSATDLSMLGLANLARAPRNAAAELREAGIGITRHAYQAGLADACQELLGHRPGGCPACRPRRLGRRSAALVSALALHENGTRGLPARTLVLAADTAALLVPSRRWPRATG